MKASFLTVLVAGVTMVVISTLTANADSKTRRDPPPAEYPEWPQCEAGSIYNGGGYGQGYLQPGYYGSYPKDTLAEARATALENIPANVEFDIGPCPAGHVLGVNINSQITDCEFVRDPPLPGEDYEYQCRSEAAYRWICCSAIPVAVTF